MNSRKFTITLLVIIIVSALLLLTACVEIPDSPEIKYGEFPFKITYKLDGEVYTVEDVYICEYKGLGFTSEYCGFYNRWEGHIKDTDNGVSFNGSLFIAEQDDVVLRCYVGSPYYFIWG